MTQSPTTSRRKQCAHCPWKVSTDPHTIPGGYSVEKHKRLRSTLAQGDACEQVYARKLSVMACHETTGGSELPCVGWLANQLGPGNNIGLRLQAIRDRSLLAWELDGEQHERFEDTLPDDEDERE